MKAILQSAYGTAEKVLRYGDAPVPAVRDDEVLVRVRAASVHADVWHVIAGRPFVLRLMGAGLRKPARPIPGTDLAGVVEAVGARVTRFKPGDAVFGETHRGMQWNNGGSYAELAAVPEDVLAMQPAGVSFEQAAVVPTSGLIALDNLRGIAALKAGEHVLVNGAAGAVGGMAVQLAKAYGARVTGVDHGAKLDVVRALGADAAVDYTRDDFTQRGERYDVIFDVASNLSFLACRKVLTPTGRYVLIGHDHYGHANGRVLGSIAQFLGLQALKPFVTGLPRVSFYEGNKAAGLEELRGLLEAGKLIPVIDRVFPLAEAAQALAYLQSEKARGRIVVTP
jgi:NADPH:quinone reductase-like Zn-dependent oxidoreductase